MSSPYTRDIVGAFGQQTNVAADFRPFFDAGQQTEEVGNSALEKTSRRRYNRYWGLAAAIPAKCARRRRKPDFQTNLTDFGAELQRLSGIEGYLRQKRFPTMRFLTLRMRRPLRRPKN